MPRELTPKQRRFIAAYQTGVSATQAAIDAGYSPKSAKHAAHALLHDNKAVKGELQRIGDKLAKAAEYSGQKCMAELDEALQFARDTKQANAFVKAVELRARLANLLREKVDITVERVDVSGALAEAKARLLRSMCDPAQTIEGDFVALPSAERDRSIDNESLEPPSRLYAERLFDH
jgi:phage terminase small subunit